MSKVEAVLKPKKCLFEKEDFRIYSCEVVKRIEGEILTHPIYNNLVIKGQVQKLTIDSDYTIELEYKGENKFGHQYDIIIAQSKKPTTGTEIIKFLSDVVTSTNRAKEIVRVYPNVVDMVLKGEELDHTKLKGIGKKTVAKIVGKIIDNIGVVSIHAEFAKYGITLSALKKILNKYKGNVELAKEKILLNPYAELTSINGIGFIKADEIAININPSFKTSCERMRACVYYCVNANENNGHTWIDLHSLYDLCLSTTKECMQYFEVCLSSNEFVWIDREKTKIGRTYTISKEKFIAERLLQINNFSPIWKCEDFDKFKKIDGFELTEEQSKTTELLCNNGVVLLSGSAGTGKTSSSRAVCDMMDSLGKTYTLCTFTAKASDVVVEAMHRGCSTIHRTLGFGDNGFLYDEENKLMVDCVIVDEASMIGVKLFSSLLEAIDPTRTKLMLIFDEAQLPSIECGAIVKDLVDSNIFSLNRLLKVFRQKEGGLLDCATKCRQGQSFLSDTEVGKIQVQGERKDFVFIEEEQEVSVNKVINIFSLLLNKGVQVEDIAILSHKNIGNYGTIAINKAIQSFLHLDNPTFTIVDDELKFFLGDRVRVRTNNYNAEIYTGKVLEEEDEDGDLDKEKTGQVYNGQIGNVVECGEDYIVFEIKGVQYVYRREKLKELTLGYAMSIISSQGSGYTHVIILCNKSDTFMANRASVYVALTRAKKVCYLIGSRTSINRAIKKDVMQERNTALKQYVLLTKNKIPMFISNEDKVGHSICKTLEEVI